MMIKVFTKDKDGKISFTEEALKKLLDEAYMEGYNANNHYVYASPSITSDWYSTISKTVTANSANDSVTLTI